MDNTNTLDIQEKYTWVIDNTLRDVYRVLNQWRSTKKNYHFDDLKSVFKSYLSRHSKTKFGWRTYAQYLRYCDPMLEIHSNNMLSVSTNTCDYSFVQEFKKCVETFNYIGLFQKITLEEKEKFEKYGDNVMLDIRGINFRDIENIKF